MQTSPDVIKSFLVNLGFNVSPSGFNNFKSSLASVTNFAVKSSAAVVSIGAAAQAAVTVFSNQMEKLYYSSKKANASVGNIQALEFGFKQIGLEAGEARAAVERMEATMRSNPGMEALLNQLGVETSGKDRVDVFLDFINQLRTMPFYQAKQYASMFGIDESQLFLLQNGVDTLAEQVQLRKELAANTGFDADKAAEDSVKYQRAINGITEKLEMLYQRLVVELLPAFQTFTDFIDVWLTKLFKINTFGHLFPKEWTDEINKFIDDFKRLKDITLEADWFKGLMDATRRALHGLLNLGDALMLMLSGDYKGAKKAANLSWDYFTDQAPKEEKEENINTSTETKPNLKKTPPSINKIEEKTTETKKVTSKNKNGMPYGLRYNNPGNLMTGPGVTMGSYPSMEAGLNAMASQLIRYGKRGLDTVSAIINTYSPRKGKGNTNESTDNYIKSVSKALGVSAETQLDLNNPELLAKLMKAMIKVEQAGVMPFSESAIDEAARNKTRGGVSIAQTNHITIHGSNDPNATGRAVGNEIRTANASILRNKRDIVQ